MSGNILGNMDLVKNWRRSSLSFTKWNENRICKPEEFMKEDTFTDFKLTVGNQVFHTHKLILAIHSEYFYRLLLSGMIETSQNEMEFKDMDPQIFQIIIKYIYNGLLDCNLDDDTLTQVYFVANMLQILDLEAECIASMLTNVTPNNCLDKKSRLQKMNIFENQSDRKVHILQSLDEYIGQCVSDHWKILITSQGFLELDLEEFCMLLELKSGQDEITDFSYSFVQNDIIKGVINWLDYDLDGRHEHITSQLVHYYCLHQANTAMVKKLFEIYQKSKPSSEAFYKENLNVDQVCKGRLCPTRILNGLLVVSGVSKRLVYHFIIPELWSTEEPFLKLNRPYTLTQIIQDIGRDEKLFIQPNNFVPLGNQKYMVMSQNEDEKLVGNFLDTLTKESQCFSHHSELYHYCPTNFLTCHCIENHWTFCAQNDQEVPKINLITSCPNEDILAKSEKIQYDPSCSIFNLVKAPIGKEKTIAL